ncbi:hypothetical protein NEOLI_000635 [Neolecta irregularis DAH-3]|uniref:DUF7082 domain-containing protein n=1 Tax=Neolecta irregularis (strain DAH-3) TaxID=1198029 RepID=A0A1U7LU26_NEOID|nr:hypothetical protein NEOLI_000635 [Neolecta irregularis DAH-3]|eukprot:OLL26129.1 hypothetical protein NEOLI_000635 [Neolecta irregularis DAH-3]
MASDRSHPEREEGFLLKATVPTSAFISCFCPNRSVSHRSLHSNIPFPCLGFRDIASVGSSSVLIKKPAWILRVIPKVNLVFQYLLHWYVFDHNRHQLTFSEPNNPRGMSVYENPPEHSFAQHGNQSYNFSTSMPAQVVPAGYPSHSHVSLPDDLPAVLGSQPPSGTEGTPFSVFLSQTQYDSQPRTLKIVFGSKRCETTVLHKHGPTGGNVLHTLVPLFAETRSYNNQVNVYVVAQDDHGNEIGTVKVSQFSYLQGGARPPQKRRGSFDDSAIPRLGSPPRRPLSQPSFGSRPDDDYAHGGPHPPVHHHSFPAYTTNSESHGNPYVYGNYAHEAGHPGFYGPGGHRNPAFYHPSFMPQNHNNWSDYGENNTAGLPAPSPFGHTTAPRPDEQTVFYRTPPKQSNSAVGSAGVSVFDPQSLFPNKASLKLVGDLDEMARNWLPEEWATRRRLVQFWRQQQGNTIQCTFGPVLPAERSPNSICVSCIWWEEKGECYVTSVDTLYLLESLVGNRFTVEEKNRIRRNLEGFRPLTVSKAKPESEEFFKLIMGFPTPKPRNIEKDVKVFPWRIFSNALKKIIGKYSSGPLSSVPHVDSPAMSNASTSPYQDHMTPPGYPDHPVNQQYPSPAPSGSLKQLQPLGPPLKPPVLVTQGLPTSVYRGQQRSFASHRPSFDGRRLTRKSFDFNEYFQPSPASAESNGTKPKAPELPLVAEETAPVTSTGEGKG